MNEELEIWKDVIGYEGRYQVSNLGRMKTIGRYTEGMKNVYRPEKIMKLCNDSRNLYLSCGLWTNNKVKTVRIHRIVAIAFLENPNSLPEVNHKDGDKKNNAASNLEWCTHSENHIHKYKVLKYQSPSIWKKGRFNEHCTKATLQLNLDGTLVKEWPSAKEVGRKLGFAPSNINSCCLGKIKSSRGFIWKYKNATES